MSERLRVAFIHPDLGIGGAERLVVDAALGLQRLGHSVDIYTSHHDPSRCFEETRDGTLRVHHVVPPFPRAYRGNFHILFAHLRQLHLTWHLLRSGLASTHDVFFVDQLATCVPFLRAIVHRRVVFYVHFPDKLLANGEFVGFDAVQQEKKGSTLKRLYRIPMDWLEEKTTGSADVLLANSNFTAKVFNIFFSIARSPRIVYPGIDTSAYDSPSDLGDPDIQSVVSDRPTLLSLNRFEKKKNIALALKAYAVIRRTKVPVQNLRLVLAGGYDPRLQDNIQTLNELLELTESEKLSFWIVTPRKSTTMFNLPPFTALSPATTDVLFVLNFTGQQRAALLNARNTRALLYTPKYEHFGIGPVEAMVCGVPVIACDNGGPTESLIAAPSSARTGWLVSSANGDRPAPLVWADALHEVLHLSDSERAMLAVRGRVRAETLFSMDAMTRGVQDALCEAVRMGPVPAYSFASDVLMAVMISLVAYLVFVIAF